MASHTPGGYTEPSRHRITNIKLEPSTSKYDITLKILVDGQVAHRLAPIERGESLSWNRVVSCDVESNSRVEIRVYEKHVFGIQRVGTLEYAMSTAADQSEACFESDTKRFAVTLSFPTPEEAKQAPATALAEAQAKEKKARLLERLGPTWDVLKTILDVGGAVAELHPVAKVVFGFCNIAWQALEKQEQCDASVEKLVVDLTGMLPFVDQIEKAATMSQLRITMDKMKNLMEDASRFVIEYKSDGGPVQSLLAVVGSKAQDQVQDLLDKFGNLKEDFDRGVGVQTLETVEAVHATVDIVHGTVDLVHGAVDAVHEVLLTNAQRALLNELKPVGSARYDSARACLPGTRTDIIKEIVDWSQQRDTSEGLLWVHGQAGLGKSSIATSVRQELDARKLLAGEFFCKRDNPERRDPQQALTTIVYGLASLHSEYAKSVAEAIQGDPRLCSSPIQTQYDKLVKNPLENSSELPPPANLVVVVDALDECGTNESRRKLLAYFHQMSQLARWLKFVVTSRPDPDIQSFFDRANSGVSRRNMYEYNASSDIKLFIQDRMQQSHKSNHLPPDATNMLTERADGLFIWAKTACDLILKSHNPKSRYGLVIGGTTLHHTSSPLDALYTTAIETSLGVGDAEDTRYVRELLGAIVVCSTRAPLSVASLSNLLGELVDRSVLQSVVDSLGSVLYTDHTDPSQGGVVRVYHHSFTNYMIASAPSQFRVELERHNTDLARSCLLTMIDGLRFNICGLETSHVRNSQVSDLSARVETSISPHLRYSCLYWSSHLTQSKRGELEGLLRGFLLQPKLLYWIEVLSLLGKLDAATSCTLELSKWCQGMDDVYQLSRDTYRFLMAFYDPISKSTPHLYVSALVFCPTHTAFNQRLRSTFQNTLVVSRGGEESWSPWLRCISHPAGVLAVAISKDGRRIVSSSSDRVVRVWDAETGAALGDPLVGHSGNVYSVAFAPDGRRIVSGSEDRTVRVWDADAGTALGEPLVGHSGNVNSVAFSHDGRRIVSGSSDKTARLWDADTGTALDEPLIGHSSDVYSVAFSSDSRRIASGSRDNMIRVWDADTGAALGVPLVGHSDHVRSVAFSPDGLHIVSGSDDKTVRLWEADTGASLGDPLVGDSGMVFSVGFSPDGRHIVSGSSDMAVRVWDIETGTALGNPLIGHSSYVYSVAFTPDGRRIVSGSSDNTVRVWDADTGAALGKPPVGHSDYVRSVAFSPNGRHIVSGSEDKTVRVWDADTGIALGDPLVGHSGYVTSVAFSPDGRHIVSASYDKTLRVWDADTSAALGEPLVGHSGYVYSVAFSPDGRRIVSGSYDTTVRVWDAETSTALGEPLVGHSSYVYSVAFSPDGRRIVSGSRDNTVRVWDTETGTASGEPLVGHLGYVYSVAFSHDGRRIVSGSSDKTVRVWDADTGAAFGDPLVGHSGYVFSVAFSPDGRRIVSGSDDKTLRLWDADTGAALGEPLIGHSHHVYSVAFSPDGQHIVSGSNDKTVRVWDSALPLSGRLPHNTSRMSDSLSSDGWVCDAAMGLLLVWLPEECRRSWVDDSLFVISDGTAPRPVWIDCSRFVHGSDWKSIYTP